MFLNIGLGNSLSNSVFVGQIVFSMSRCSFLSKLKLVCVRRLRRVFVRFHVTEELCRGYLWMPLMEKRVLPNVLGCRF